jgi:hypothetical protein
MKRFVFFLVVIVIIGGIGWFLSANSSKGRNLLPDPDPRTPRIDSIVPSAGTPLETTVLISGSGFSSGNNDIVFSFPSPISGNYTTGYLNAVKSSDGKSLKFALPSAVGVCAASTAPPDTACIELALVLPNGELEISVLNQHGESNKIKFAVSKDD